MYVYMYDTGSTDINRVHIQICVYVCDINIQICVNECGWTDACIDIHVYATGSTNSNVNIQTCVYVYDIDLHVCVYRCTCMCR